MSRPRSALGGFWLGYSIVGTPGVVLALLLTLNNRDFVDAPLSLWLTWVLVPGLIGGLVGAVRGTRRTRHWAWGLAVGHPLAIAFLGWVGGGQVDSLELVVLGVDGASWDVADPLIDAGELPSLASARDEGASGILWAGEPMFSPLLWTTIATGKRPGEHGVYGFDVQADRCEVPRFWDIARAEGRTPGIYKWLVTWPPPELDAGFVVPAWLAPSAETVPDSLSFIKEIELSRRMKRARVENRRSDWVLGLEGIRHGLRWSTVRDMVLWQLYAAALDPSEDTRFVDLNLLRVRMDRDIFVAALRTHRPAVATFTTYAPDALGHRFWRYYEPDRFAGGNPEDIGSWGEAIPDTYRQADRILGEVRSLLPAQGRLVVLSDHGFQALDAARDGAPATPQTEPLEEWLEEVVGPVQLARLGTKLTVILEGDPEVQRQALDEALPALELDDETGPLYRVTAMDDDPRILAFDLNVERVHVDDPRRVGGTPINRWVRPMDAFSGDHDPAGIFVALGPGVRPGETVELNHLDVAPVLLAALGLGAGEDMEGEIPDGLWAAPPRVGSWDPVRDQIRYPILDGGDAVKEQLRALGYAD